MANNDWFIAFSGHSPIALQIPDNLDLDLDLRVKHPNIGGPHFRAGHGEAGYSAKILRLPLETRVIPRLKI